MVKNLKRFQKNLEKDFGRAEDSKWDFYPSTFTLPSEYHLFVTEFSRSPGSTWIMKPVSKWDIFQKTVWVTEPHCSKFFKKKFVMFI